MPGPKQTQLHVIRTQLLQGFAPRPARAFLPTRCRHREWPRTPVPARPHAATTARDDPHRPSRAARRNGFRFLVDPLNRQTTWSSTREDRSADRTGMTIVPEEQMSMQAKPARAGLPQALHAGAYLGLPPAGARPSSPSPAKNRSNPGAQRAASSATSNAVTAPANTSIV